MSMYPGDPASEAFERLRLEVALLRRGVEGLAGEDQVEPVDYTPTLAELSNAIGEVRAQLAALSERLAMSPKDLGLLLEHASARVLARPLGELELDRAALNRATEAMRAAGHADSLRRRDWRRYAAASASGLVAGAVLWGVVAGPLARSLPVSWSAPERLAAATLALPMASAGERLLERADPHGAQALRTAKSLQMGQRKALERCLQQLSRGERELCTVKLR